MTTLTFDPATHTYAIDGRTLPSVTQVLKAEGLIDTSGPWYTDWHSGRGNAIHAALEFDDQGDLDYASLDPEIKPYVDAWRDFKAKVGVKCIHIERRLHCPHRWYAGMIDRVLNIRSEIPGIILDIKTGGPERWHAIQTAAYKGLAMSNNLLGTSSMTDRACLYLKPNGKHKLVTHKDPSDWDVWCGALALYHWKAGGR